MDCKIKYLPLAVQDLRDIAQYLSGFFLRLPRVCCEKSYAGRCPATPT